MLGVGLAVLKAVLVTFFEHGGVPYYVIKKSSGVGFYGNSIIANKKYCLSTKIVAVYCRIFRKRILYCKKFTNGSSAAVEYGTAGRLESAASAYNSKADIRHENEVI